MFEPGDYVSLFRKGYFFCGGEVDHIQKDAARIYCDDGIYRNWPIRKLHHATIAQMRREGLIPEPRPLATWTNGIEIGKTYADDLDAKAAGWWIVK